MTAPSPDLEELLRYNREAALRDRPNFCPACAVPFEPVWLWTEWGYRTLTICCPRCLKR
jgi:hypothetical protein